MLFHVSCEVRQSSITYVYVNTHTHARSEVHVSGAEVGVMLRLHTHTRSEVHVSGAEVGVMLRLLGEHTHTHAVRCM